MQITLLGTGSPIPDPLRAGPATLVCAAGSTILVDCGRGVLMRLAAAGVPPPMLSAVLLTHLHSDHLTDLNDVITTHWVMSAEPVALSVFGPPGVQEVVDATLGALAPDIRYRLAHHADLTEPPMLDVTGQLSRAGRRATGITERRTGPSVTARSISQLAHGPTTKMGCACKSFRRASASSG